MDIFWASENNTEGFNYEAAAQNTNKVRDRMPDKQSNEVVLHGIPISLVYLLHAILFLTAVNWGLYFSHILVFYVIRAP